MTTSDVNCDDEFIVEDTVSLPADLCLMHRVKEGVVSSNVGCSKIIVRRLPGIPVIKVRDDVHFNKIGVAFAKIVRNLDQLVRFTAWGQLRTCNGTLPSWILPYDVTNVVCSKYMAVEMLRANTNARIACTDDFGVLCRERSLIRPLYVAVDVDDDQVILYVTDGIEVFSSRGTVDTCLSDAVVHYTAVRQIVPKSPGEIELRERGTPYLVMVSEKPTTIGPTFVASVEHSGHAWVSEVNATRVGAIAEACAAATHPIDPVVGNSSLTKQLETETLLASNDTTYGTYTTNFDGVESGYIGWVRHSNRLYRSVGMFSIPSLAVESACSVYYGVNPPIKCIRDHESIARRELKLYESQESRFKYDVIVGPERVGMICSIVAAIAPEADTVIAPGDGIGVVGLACRIMGIPCVSSDACPSYYSYVPVVTEDALATVSRSFPRRSVFLLSHVCEFVPSLLDVVIATGRDVVVYEEQDMISGLSSLVRCSRKIWASRRLAALLTPLGNVDRTKRLALNLMSEQILAHSTIGFAASTAMREIKYVANLGIARDWVYLGPRTNVKGAHEMLARYGQRVGIVPDVTIVWSEAEMRDIRNSDIRSHVFLDMRTRRVASYDKLYKDKRIIRNLHDQLCLTGYLYTIDCSELAAGHGLEPKHTGHGVILYRVEPGVRVVESCYGCSIKFTFVPP